MKRTEVDMGSHRSGRGAAIRLARSKKTMVLLTAGLLVAALASLLIFLRERPSEVIRRVRDFSLTRDSVTVKSPSRIVVLVETVPPQQAFVEVYVNCQENVAVPLRGIGVRFDNSTILRGQTPIEAPARLPAPPNEPPWDLCNVAVLEKGQTSGLGITEIRVYRE